MENYITKAINKVKILFKNKNLAVNAMLNGLRVISNMIVPLISLPYLTRILQKENYGKFSFCNSIISYFVLISGLGISSYAIREGSRIREDNNELVSFSHEILGINIFSTLCAYVLLIITLLVWKPSSDYVKVIIALSPMIISGVLGFEWLPNVIEDFLYITVRGVIIQIISLICIFIFVKQPSDLVVYAVITGGSSLLTAFFNLYYAKKHISINIRKISFRKKHIRPIFILFANTLMISVYLQSDITMIGMMKSDVSVGIYKVSVQIYSMIKTLINAVTVVVIPRLSLCLSKDDKKTYNETSAKIIQWLLAIGIPCITGLFLIADNCIMIVAGKSYEGSILPLKILCAALPFAVIGNFFANAVLVVNRKERLSLVSTVISALINIVLNLFMIPKFDFVGAAVTTVIAEIVVSVLLMVFSRKYVSIHLDYKVLFPIVAEVIAIVFICRMADLLKMNVFCDTAMKIALSLVAYVVILALAGILQKRLASRRK